MDEKHCLKETREQPAAWEDVLTTVAALGPEVKVLLAEADSIILTGCGSALNASFVGAAVLQRYNGMVARAVPAADVFQFPETCFAKGTNPVVIAISRSGETTETVFAQREAAERGHRTISLTCLDSTMSAESDLAIVLSGCEEKSVCTTKSVSGMVLALQLMASFDNLEFLDELRQLPVVGEKLIAAAMKVGEKLAHQEAVGKYSFIGSGPLYGIARECQLKVKEMTLLPSDCYPLMDYRHGPKSNVDESMLVTMLCSDSGRYWERECADELMGHGGKLLVISDLPVAGKHTFELYFNAGLSEYARAILYLPVVQAMAAHKALSLGADPDNPKNLSYWVETKSLQRV